MAASLRLMRSSAMNWHEAPKPCSGPHNPLASARLRKIHRWRRIFSSRSHRDGRAGKPPGHPVDDGTVAASKAMIDPRQQDGVHFAAASTQQCHVVLCHLRQNKLVIFALRQKDRQSMRQNTGGIARGSDRHGSKSIGFGTDRKGCSSPRAVFCRRTRCKPIRRTPRPSGSRSVWPAPGPRAQSAL